jgi:hypothetical protein
VTLGPDGFEGPTGKAHPHAPDASSMHFASAGATHLPALVQLGSVSIQSWEATSPSIGHKKPAGELPEPLHTDPSMQ